MTILMKRKCMAKDDASRLVKKVMKRTEQIQGREHLKKALARKVKKWQKNVGGS